MRIALLSDTHIPTGLARLPDELLEQLRGVGAILHAGDLVSLGVLDRLSAIAPTTAVFGNMDPLEVAAKLNDREILRLGGQTIGLKHGHQHPALQSQYIGLDYAAPEFEVFYQAMAEQLPGAEVIVFGHFHQATVKEWNGRLFINPGAVAPSHGRSSFALLELGNRVEVKIVPLKRTSGSEEATERVE